MKPITIEITRVRLVFEPERTAEVPKATEKMEQTIKRTKELTAKMPKQRRTRTLFNDQQKADILRRYQAGEGPTAIANSLGCSRSLVGCIIKEAGAVEGRTGSHLAALNKSRAKAAEPEAEEEPV